MVFSGQNDLRRGQEMPIMSRININLSAWDTSNTITWNINLYKLSKEGSPMAKIQVTPRGQTIIPLPTPLVKALQWKKGAQISFKINKQGNLEMGKECTTRQVHGTGS